MTNIFIEALEQAMREIAQHHHYCPACARVFVCRCGGVCAPAVLGAVQNQLCPPCYHAERTPPQPEYLSDAEGRRLRGR
jgi:hypothetical protein